MITALTLSLAATLAPPQSSGTPGYDFEILSTPIEAKSAGTALSGTGVVAGYLWGTGVGPITACIWVDGVRKVIGASVPEGINAHGVVVGTDSTGFPLPFRYRDQTGVFEYLPRPNGGWGLAFDVSSKGSSVGLVSSAPGIYPDVAVMWDRAGTPSLLGTLGGSGSDARAISDTESVVGHSYLAGDVVRRPFVYSAGKMRQLRILDGDVEGFAADVNEHGVIVGSSRAANGVDRAVIWVDGHVRELAPGAKSSAAVAINNRGGVIVQRVQPYLYAHGQAYKLADLASTPKKWKYSSASDIDDDGRIVGMGVNKKGLQRAFLLTPSLANLDHDPFVDRKDAVLFAVAYATRDGLADVDRNGTVDRADLAAFVAAYR